MATVLHYKRIPQTLDFASCTWDQANRLALYEMCRMNGLDPNANGSLGAFLQTLFSELIGALWDPPVTITLEVWAESVDDSWNILKAADNTGGNSQPFCGRRVTIHPEVSAEWAGDYELMGATYTPFGDAEQVATGEGSGPSLDNTGSTSGGGGKLTLTLRTYDERWLGIDTSQQPSYLNLPLPIIGDLDG